MSRVLDYAFNNPLKLEEQAAMPFAGGIMQHGYQCGMIWGASLAVGAQAFQLFGPGPKAEVAAVFAAKRVVESFNLLNNNINCFEITELDKSSSSWQMIIYFLIKGGSIGCLRRAAKYAPIAFNEIKTVLSEELINVPSPPISCAAMLAQKMGVSDIHTVMAAGFAGGIGLCGGACGALGAAIWIIGMNSIKEEDDKIEFKNPKAMEKIDRFLRCTDFKFECSEIVGRHFEDIEDHSKYIKNGGCSKLINVIAES